MSIKVLHFILYGNLFPPKNGGMLRCWNIMEQVSRYYDVDVITLQNDINEGVNKSGYTPPGSARFLVPIKYKSDSSGFKKYPLINKLWAAIKYRWYYRTLSSADSGLLDMVPMFRLIADNHYDLVIFEHLESLRLWRKIKSLFPNALIIFDAHNIDHILLRNTGNKRRLSRIIKTESTLYKNCNLILATSYADAEIFKAINKKDIAITIVPNGVDVHLNPYQLPDFTSDQKKLIFCGSLDYEPNQLGLIWFLRNVWQDVIKKHPAIILLVVGRGQPGNTLSNALKDGANVELIGEVDKVIPYYRQAQCAIVPLLHGSGTRLKILEAMSLGVPVISTSIAAEGINCRNGENILICNKPNGYIGMIDRLYEDATDFINISGNARKLVTQEYSWSKIGNSLHRELEKLNRRV